MIEYLIIIQARLTSTRLPNKVMMTVGGVPMVKRVWLQACTYRNLLNELEKPDFVKVIVAWPERYPDLDENNVLERFRRIAQEFPSKYIVRLTSDCPLIESWEIAYAIDRFEHGGSYYCNHKDGHDVQVFTRDVLFGNVLTSKEHVILDTGTLPTGESVNTVQDLNHVRAKCKIKSS